MQIEIWSDLVCPWCAIGRARFDKALLGFDHRDSVVVRYRSFELDPNAPARRDLSMVDHLARKYGTSREEAERSTDHMVSLAGADGVVMDFEQFNAGNTFDAHRLLHLAWDKGCQSELKSVLLAATFGSGLVISDPTALATAASGVGLDPGEVTEVLNSDRYGDAVRADERRAAELNITGVPFMLIDGKLGLPGAQSVERVGQALEAGWRKSHDSAP